MNIYFSKLLSDKIVRRSMMASLFLLVITLGYLGLVYNRLPPFVPVFNQLPWGIDRVGDKVIIFLPPTIAIILFIGNMIFSQISYNKMPLIVRMISITTFFICVITCIFAVRITLLIL